MVSKWVGCDQPGKALLLSDHCGHAADGYESSFFKKLSYTIEPYACMCWPPGGSGEPTDAFAGLPQLPNG